MKQTIILRGLLWCRQENNFFEKVILYSIVIDVMLASVFVMDHCKTKFYFIINKSLYKILIIFDLLTYFI
jgi:hypothetical protein